MYLTFAWRNIWRNKRRTYITIASIAFAVFFACLMRSVQLGQYEGMIRNAAEFYTGYAQVHQKGYWDDKTVDNSFINEKEILSTVTSTSNVDLVVPRVESFGLASYKQKTKGALVMGINPDKEDGLTKIKSKLVEGSYLGVGDDGAMIGQGLAKYLKIGLGDTLILLSQGYHGANAAGLYPIKGIIKFPSPVLNDQNIMLTIDKAQWFYNLEGRLTSLALVLDKAKSTNKVVDELRSELDTTKLEVMGWEEMMPELVQSIEIDNMSGQFTLWILYAVIGFGMLGTFMMMTAERQYEFGVVISLGMKRIILQAVIFLEMAILTGMGVLSGIGLSLPFLIYFNQNPIYLSGEMAETIEKMGVEAAYFFSLDPSLFYNQAWTIFFMALILSIYPLISIWRLKPVTAMRTL